MRPEHSAPDSALDANRLLEEAISKYANTVKRVSFMYIRNAADAEDIMQEVFIKYMLRAHRGERFESDQHEKSWILRVTVNQCKDYMKSYWRRNVSQIGDQDFAAPEEDGGGVLEYIRMLPKNYRVLFYLFYYETYTVPEISKITGVKTNTIYSSLSRARVMLKKYMEGGGSDE